MNLNLSISPNQDGLFWWNAELRRETQKHLIDLTDKRVIWKKLTKFRWMQTVTWYVQTVVVSTRHLSRQEVCADFCTLTSKNMNKSESSLRLHKHHWRAMDGVSDGWSGRSNIWWPAGWEGWAQQGEATQRWDGGFTLAAERRLHCWICVHAKKKKKKHPEKHKKK